MITLQNLLQRQQNETAQAVKRHDPIATQYAMIARHSAERNACINYGLQQMREGVVLLALGSALATIGAVLALVLC